MPANANSVYDIGNIDTPTAPKRPENSPQSPIRPRPASRARSAATRRARGGSRLAGSVSLFVPGSGSILGGEWATGVFFLTSIGFVGALAWSIVETLERLSGSLGALGMRPEMSLWALGLTFLFAGCLHVGSVVASQSDEPETALPTAIPAVASALVPGWGQLLNGHTIRAAVFLGGVWLVAAAWILDSAPAAQLMGSFDVHLPAALQVITMTAVLWTLPAVLWTVSIYDAVLGAIRRRDSLI